MIRAVLFDFWQTIAADTPESLARATALRLEGVGAVLGRSGYPAAPEALEAAYQESGRRLNALYQEHRDLSSREQIALFLDTVAPELSRRLAPERLEEAVRAYTTPALHFPPTPCAGALEAVRALASQGFVLGIVSNTGRTPGVVIRGLLARFGLGDSFRVTSFSDEVGFRKPRSEIFQAALAQAGMDPRSVVHVGDSVEADVAGARAAGIRAIHYAPDGKPGSAAADLVVRDLRDLPDVLLQAF